MIHIIRKIISGCKYAIFGLIIIFVLTVMFLSAFIAGTAFGVFALAQTDQAQNIGFKDGIPLHDKFTEIAQRPYSLDFYDCSNKVLEYGKACESKGLSVRIILTLFPSGIAHATLFVDTYGIYDPTNNKYSYIPGARSVVREFINDEWLTHQYGYYYADMTIDEAQIKHPEEFPSD